MNKTVARSSAIQAVILILACILIVLVFPVRVLKETYATDAGVESAEEALIASEPVTQEERLTQRFTAQYDRIRSLDIYICEVTLGRSIELQILDEHYQMLHMRYYDLQKESVPGLVRLPLGLDLEVGKEYILVLRGLFSTVEYGLVPSADTSVYLGTAAYANTVIEHEKLAFSICYELPLSKSKSVAVMGVIALVTLFAVMLVRRHYQKPLLPFLRSAPKPVSRLVMDPPVTLRRALQVVLNPVVCAGFGTLFVLNWPLKRFDDRPLDLAFYALGILIAWGLALVFINQPGHPERSEGSFIHHFLQALTIAAMLWYSTDYMNGLYDLQHHISERQITIAFSLLLLLTFTRREIPKLPTSIYAVVSAVAAVFYLRGNLLAETEKDYEDLNLVLKLTTACVILTGLLLLWLLWGFIKLDALQTLRRQRLSFFGILTVLTALLLVLFRNGRGWILALVFFYGLFYLRYLLWEGRRQWTQILAGGLALHFVLTVGYCLLYRYYAAFITSRFAMRFHTVTVTAEYLTVMMGVAFVLFLSRAIKVYNTKGRCSGMEWLRACFTELVFLGVVSVYTILTLSRTAYLAVMAVGGILFAFGTMVQRKDRLHSLLMRVAAALAAVLLLFPAVFTLQRLVPVMVGHPLIFTSEGADVRITAGINWDHRNLMCAERFIGQFQEKILGMESAGYDYPEDRYNYDENGEPVYDRSGNPLRATDSGPRRIRNLRGEMTQEDSIENFSNGRMTIFRCYVEQMGFWGHEEMGALFDDGTPILHAHNVYLQVMYDCGVMAGILFVLWLLTGCVTAAGCFLQQAEQEPCVLLILAMFAGFMVAGLTEWNFQYANPMTIALLLSVAPLLVKDRAEQRGV